MAVSSHLLSAQQHVSHVLTPSDGGTAAPTAGVLAAESPVNLPSSPGSKQNTSTVSDTIGGRIFSSFQFIAMSLYAHKVSLTDSPKTGPVFYVTDATGSMNKSQRQESPGTYFETGLDCCRRFAKDFLERERRLGDTLQRIRRARACARV